MTCIYTKETGINQSSAMITTISEAHHILQYRNTWGFVSLDEELFITTKCSVEEQPSNEHNVRYAYLCFYNSSVRYHKKSWFKNRGQVKIDSSEFSEEISPSCLH